MFKMARLYRTYWGDQLYRTYWVTNATGKCNAAEVINMDFLPKWLNFGLLLNFSFFKIFFYQNDHIYIFVIGIYIYIYIVLGI